MADPTGLSSVLAGKALDATIGYVQTANRYNARHKDLEDLVHTTGAFLQAIPSDVASAIVQRVFRDVEPLHKGAQKLVRKRQEWEDKTTTFDRHVRLHTRWKLSKDALDHTQKIRTTEADRLPRAILVSVLDLQKELKSLRKDVRDIKSLLGHSGACKQETAGQEKVQTRKSFQWTPRHPETKKGVASDEILWRETPTQEKRKQKELKSLRKDVRDIKSLSGHSGECKQETITQEKVQTRKGLRWIPRHPETKEDVASDEMLWGDTLTQEKRKQKRRKPKRSKQEKDGEALGKGMDTARADCINNFALGLRSIQERLLEAIIEGSHDTFCDVIEGAMRQVVDLHLEYNRSAQVNRPCPSSTVTSESWDSTITVDSFCQIRDGEDLTNAGMPERIEEIEAVEAEEIELAENVDIDEEAHETEMVEVERIEQVRWPTGSQDISRKIPYRKTDNFIFILRNIWRNKALKTATNNFGDHILGDSLHLGRLNSQTPDVSKAFTYKELKEATNAFSPSNLIGEGGFGRVYKGIIAGNFVAVKQLQIRGEQGEREFRVELEIVSRVHHRHLVSMVGYCMSGRHRLLVYEYVPNGTLEQALHGRGKPCMDWATRMNIALGIARGLTYLHEDCHPSIIHRDIKGSNILLDNQWEAQVADFGLAKLACSHTQTHVTTRVMGTFGYVDPVYAMTGQLTEKSDVYSFGVVLLELISGKKPTFHDSLVQWARPLLTRALETGNVDAVADPNLMDKCDEKQLFRMVEVAATCVHELLSQRPKMAEALRSLSEFGPSSREWIAAAPVLGSDAPV